MKKLKTAQPEGENQDLEETEDLPFDVVDLELETEQTEQTSGFEPVAEGEEWIAKAQAIIRVREAVYLAAHGPEHEERESTKRAKARFLDVYAKNLGTIGVACEKAEVARTQYYHWLKTDPQFRSAVMAVDEQRNDMVEDELFALIQKHDGPSIRFFMERRNPNYKQRTSTEIVTGDKTFEELLYSMAEKRKALAEQTNGDKAK